MKPETQEKFDRIIKESFIEILKPLGFKKKTNNFYLQLEKIGHIINVQKSYYSTRDSSSTRSNVYKIEKRRSMILMEHMYSIAY
ncbi:DUF4304 domain-containing protein [Sphingobacterium multivorum]|jgi:Domain of unknown function (DUF4304)|uniref:DUF4304 domain-containing protein n=1 Tax=Sphingobacterium multivorum TaxID=28454 RepID=UPI0035E42724